MPAFPALNDRNKAARLIIVLGDQLDPTIGPVADAAEGDVVLMMEVDDESTHVPSHKQRTALFLSAMRHFAVELAERGVRVRYVTLSNPRNTHTFSGEILRAVGACRPDSVHATHPGSWRVLAMLTSLRSELGIPLEIHPDEHFLTPPDVFNAWADGRKQWTMEHFYREQRRRLGVLMEPDGRSPVGGKWNLDADNRESFKRAPEPPPPYRPRPDAITEEVLDLVDRRFASNPGSLEGFSWPVTRAQAMSALDDFIANRLADFGRWEDAMWEGQPFLYHSLLSAAANLKLLDPRACVAKAVAAYGSGDAPLNSVEGFVRQWIGWREFIRGVYWHQGEGYPNRNGLGHDGELPGFYWDAATDMNCVCDCLGHVRDHAYAHHIPRLMVMGNLAMLAGVNARAVGDWYLAMFADAVDWASCPNTIGMSQHADGGIVGTKPYAASGKYIARMSNYCRGCRYDPRERTGDNACPFNTLYWDFLLRHAERFRSNHRMSMMIRNAQRIGRAERVELTARGAELRERWGV